MKKTIKVIGKVLAVPFGLLKIAVMITMIPITILEELLEGNIKTYFKKVKVLNHIFKTAVKDIWNSENFKLESKFSYTNDNEYSEICKTTGCNNKMSFSSNKTFISKSTYEKEQQ